MQPFITGTRLLAKHFLTVLSGTQLWCVSETNHETSPPIWLRNRVVFCDRTRLYRNKPNGERNRVDWTRFVKEDSEKYRARLTLKCCAITRLYSTKLLTYCCASWTVSVNNVSILPKRVIPCREQICLVGFLLFIRNISRFELMITNEARETTTELK